MNVPFFHVEASRTQQLKELTDEYKHLHGHKQDPGSPSGALSGFIDHSKLHARPEESGRSAEKW